MTHVTASTSGYSARRTLSVRVELVRQLRRRRTLIAFAVGMFMQSKRTNNNQEEE